MKRISSRWTFFYKRVFPFFIYGVVLMGPAFVFFSESRNGAPVVLLVVPLLFFFLLSFLFKQLIFDLVDQAWDAGDYLLFKNKGVEETVPLTNIMNVSYTVIMNPPRVTLTLRTPSRLGKEITFSPPTSMNPLNSFKKSPIIDELIQRVDRARSR